MTRTTTTLAAALFAGLSLATLPVHAGGPAGTTVTYQGRLLDGGAPASGMLNCEFRLFSAEVGGSQVGSTVLTTESITDGIITASLDFGVAPYTSAQPLWLEVVIEGETLTRQQLTSAPFSLATRGVDVGADGRVTFGSDGLGSAALGSEISFASPTNAPGMIIRRGDGAGGTLSRWDMYADGGGRLQFRHDQSTTDRVVFDSDANVGIGTTTPLAKLHVNGGTTVEGDLIVNGPNGIAMPSWDIEIMGGDLNFSENNVATRLRIEQGGNVGIGTTSPESRLHVRNGSAGLAPHPLSEFVIEGSADASMNLIVPNGEEAGIFFGNPANGARDGAIIYNPFGGVNPGGLNFRVSPAQITAMAIRSNGNVGIGTTNPGFLLEVDGSAGKPGGGSWSVASDARLKTNVEDLHGALDTLLGLRGVTYEYKDPDAINELSGTRVGFIAQEVEAVIPDWVAERTDGYKALTIRGFEAMAVEAMRELSDENEELRNRLAALEAVVEQLATDR